MRRLLLLTVLLLSLSACLNHFIFHSKTDPPGVRTWSETVARGKLLIRLEWARPEGEGPFPAVIVHPEAGHVAGEMRGVVRDLAKEGYLAVAADYRRERNGIYRETLFTWQDPDDPRAVMDLVRRRPDVDPRRIGLLGFSQGGVYSLLIAAYTQQAAAVVAYYPVTDFASWLEESAGEGRGRRFVFRLIRRHFRKQSGARDEADFEERLARASALRQAEALRAPVLLIHGERDRSAGLNESVRLTERLKELHREVELVVIPDAGHVFNFRDREKARTAWEATLRWLDRYLRPRAT
ncbi:MAG TPA: alpha/beta fold hydrolase [Thermoanaerobaculia bacterium]|jgi:dipeptidyl aminopeptidase/acylaminoacyl peptidase